MATKEVIELRGLEYRERLRELGLTDLETEEGKGVTFYKDK